MQEAQNHISSLSRVRVENPISTVHLICSNKHLNLPFSKTDHCTNTHLGVWARMMIFLNLINLAKSIFVFLTKTGLHI